MHAGGAQVDAPGGAAPHSSLEAAPSPWLGASQTRRPEPKCWKRLLHGGSNRPEERGPPHHGRLQLRLSPALYPASDEAESDAPSTEPHEVAGTSVNMSGNGARSPRAPRSQSEGLAKTAVRLKLMTEDMVGPRWLVRSC